ncbi:MAG: alkaline phosphatase family protein [Nitrososphaerota archaeon]|nr:alkaline phosphatase family protein [Nitrososphaerota archaeon]
MQGRPDLARLGAAAVLVILCFQMLAGASFAASTTTATPIKHVVIVMMENHSFDNIFGLYPTMNLSEPGPALGSLQAPDDVLGAPKGVTLTQVPNGTYSTANPVESVYPLDWNNGKMDGFPANSGSQSMTYFSSSQLAVEWDWAEQYAIADRYFASCLCETNPNRLYSLAGYGAGISDDAGPPPYVPVNQSIFGELSRYGVSWGYYVENPAANNFPLNYFDGIVAYSSNLQSFGSFYGALSQGTLPSVSWVMPVGGGASGIDQHPEANVTQGQDWLLGIVGGVMRSQYWNSTAVFITYDEGGGYYDHVAPPVVDGVQLGFRVPLFVISPYAKENYVSQTVMNHASTLAFVDYNWKLPALNTFVADSGLPLDMFDFNQTYGDGTLVRQPVVLGNQSAFPGVPQIPFVNLPYQREGAYSGDLSSMGTAIYISGNSTVTPFYESIPFMGVVSVVLLALLVVAARYGRSLKRRRSGQQAS